MIDLEVIQEKLFLQKEVAFIFFTRMALLTILAIVFCAYCYGRNVPSEYYSKEFLSCITWTIFCVAIHTATIRHERDVNKRYSYLKGKT